MDGGTEQIVVRRRNSNDQSIFQKVFGILSHQETTDSNYIGIPSQQGQDGLYQENR